ncbi:MAG: carboxypeptidase regulatory-like domain-containing protein [Ignavibacteria bacterium]|nr:carboxypeptidase regulatory-like domain-containing protein [Ignavibacteria bacterium]
MPSLRMSRILVIFALAAFSVVEALAGDDPSNPLEEKVPVELKIRGIGRTELFILRKDRRIYLPVSEVFTFLRINASISPDRNRVSGFFVNADSQYVIDVKLGSAQLKDRTVPLSSDKYIVSPQDLYLESGILRDLFHIESAFDSRRLTVTLRSAGQLPIEILLERQRNRDRALRSHEKPIPSYDFGRAASMFGGTRVDWRLASSVFEHQTPRHAYTLGVGGKIIGGDFEARFRGNVRERLRENNVNAFIRYPFFDNRWLRQITIGDLTENDPVFSGRVRGVEFTNKPAPRRLLLGSEVLSVEAAASQDVELYEGGVLQSFIKSRRDSMYNFELDMPYGVSDFEIRRYDEWGGVSSERFRSNIPQILIPPNEVQYSILGGQLRNFAKARYGKATVDVGASERITIGGDLWYYRSKGESSHWFPGFSSTARIAPGVIGEFNFSPLLASRVSLSALFPSQAFINYTNVRFNVNSPFNVSRVIDQHGLSINVPIGVGTRQLFISVQAVQTMFENQRDQSLIGGIAGYTGGWRFDVTNSAGWTRLGDLPSLRRFWTTRVNSSFRLPADVVFAITTLYNHQTSEVQDFGAVVNRAITSDLLLTASYTHTFKPSFTFFRLQALLDLPFLRFEARGLRSNSEYQYDQVLSGSIVTSSTVRDFFFEDRLRLGRGALSFRPFLDRNGNGIRDQGESYLPDITVKTYGPKLSAAGEKKKEGVLIANAEAYQKYITYFPVQNFEDPHWVPYFQSVAVMAEPNLLRPLDLPIVIGGLVSGRVVQVQKGAEVPVEGITVTLSNTGYSKTMRSFSTGEFNFIGVPPGTYTLSISTQDLEAGGLRSDQAEKPIEVRAVPEGDVIENLIFKVVER